ncbi:MAG: methyltransferase domain-containing protein [Acidobacteriota bacterium]
MLGLDADTASFWDEKYRADLTPWDRGDVSPALAHWLENGALTPCRILIPGCGLGHEVMALARRGFEVWGVDIALTPVQKLREKLAAEGLTAHLVQGDVRDWQPGQPFDAIYEQTCLCALSPTDWPRYEAQLYCWLRPGGLLFALLMQTAQVGGPPYHCGLEEMQVLFTPGRWRWLELPQRTVPHPVGFFEYAAMLERLG